MGTIAFTALGLILVYADVRAIQTVHWAVKMGDVTEVSPPLWTIWVRLVAISVAILGVVASEIAAFSTSRS
ncbi:MAG: hypothetical protein H6835_17470 [Planctomycetes bacterium]|nr:hypothetical protein [Planctomycetota bacterium]